MVSASDSCLPAVGQKDADLAGDAIGLGDEGLGRGALARGERAGRAAAELGDHLLAHAFGAVMGAGVGYFVGDDGGQARFVFGDGKDAGVNADLAAGEAPGVGFGAFEEDEFPLGVGEQGDGGNALADTLDHSAGLGIGAGGGFLPGLLEGGDAELRFLVGRDDIELAAAGFQ